MRSKSNEDDNSQTTDISVDGVENVMEEVIKLESEDTTKLEIKDEQLEQEMNSDGDFIEEEMALPELNGDNLNENGDEGINGTEAAEEVEETPENEDTADIDEEVSTNENGEQEILETKGENEAGGEEEPVVEANVHSNDNEEPEEDSIVQADGATLVNPDETKGKLEEIIDDEKDKDVVENVPEESWRDMISRGKFLTLLPPDFTFISNLKPSF